MPASPLSFSKSCTKNFYALIRNGRRKLMHRRLNDCSRPGTYCEPIATVPSLDRLFWQSSNFTDVRYPRGARAAYAAEVTAQFLGRLDSDEKAEHAAQIDHTRGSWNPIPAFQRLRFSEKPQCLQCVRH
jgi:hypothetical protein